MAVVDQMTTFTVVSPRTAIRPNELLEDDFSVNAGEWLVLNKIKSKYHCTFSRLCRRRRAALTLASAAAVSSLLQQSFFTVLDSSPLQQLESCPQQSPFFFLSPASTFFLFCHPNRSAHVCGRSLISCVTIQRKQYAKMGKPAV